MSTKITIPLPESQLRALHQMIQEVDHNRVKDAATREMVKHLMVNLFLKVTRRLISPPGKSIKISLNKAEAAALLYTMFCVDLSAYGPFEMAVRHTVITFIQPHLQ